MSGFDAPGASAAKRGWGFAVQRGEAASIASICARRSGCTFAPWCGSGAKASAVTANANMLIGSMLVRHHRDDETPLRAAREN